MSKVSTLAINAADHLIKKGRLDAAASILRNYLATNSPRPDILQRLGRILLSQGRSAEAVPLFEKALKQFQESGAQSKSPDHSAIVSASRLAGELASPASSTLDAEAS